MHNICHIAGLPAELLEIIFDDLIIATRQSPVTLWAVCSRWRTMIRRCPRYWRTLVLRSTMTVPKLKQRIQLAGGAVQRLLVHGMETERFIRLARILKPALENVEEVYVEASREHFSHLAAAGALQCSPSVLTLRGPRYVKQTARSPLGIPMMSNKLRELYISSFIPNWSSFVGLTPSLKVLHVSDGDLPPHAVLTNMLIGLPQLESLFLDGAIDLSHSMTARNVLSPNPSSAVLPSARKLEVLLRPRVFHGGMYWLTEPAQAHRLQYLRLEGCCIHRWLHSLLAPPIPPLVQLYIHFPQGELSTHGIPVNLGRTLERFAFTDTSMSLSCLVPLLAASERLQWLDISRTFVDWDMLRRLLTPRVDGKSALTTLIAHGCQRLSKDAVDWVQGHAITVEADASVSSPLWD